MSLRLAVAALALAFLLPPLARAEDESDHAAFGRTTLQVSLDAQTQLAEVDRLLERGKSSGAMDALHEMLGGSPEEVVKRSGLTNKFRHYVGVRQACRDRLWALWRREPGGGAEDVAGGELLRRYRETYDGVAVKLYRSALIAGDVAGLARVAYDYAGTSWGERALLTLGDLFAEEGNPAEALVYWEEMLLRWGLGPRPMLRWEDLVCRIVGAHLQLGHRDEVARYGKGYALALRLTGALASGFLNDGGASSRSGAALAEAYLQAPVGLAGERRPLRTVLHELAAALERTQKSWSGDEWLTLGGGLEPAGLRAPVLAVGPLAWTADVLEVHVSGDIPTLHGPDRQQAWGKSVVNLMDVGIWTALVQPIHPLVSGGRVYVMNDVRGRVLDLKTGEALGSFGDFVLSPTGGFAADDGLISFPQGLAAHGRSLLAVKRATRRLAVDSGAEESERRLPPQGVEAFDLLHGARRRWDTRDVADEESRAFYQEACFHGPPAADERSAYVGAYKVENDVKAFLTSIDLRTGKLNWKTFLCAEQLSSFAAVNPRPGTAPVKVGGLVIWCSNQGVIGGFDALTGEVRWLLQYPRRISYTYGGSVDSAPGWSDNPPVVSDRVLFLTPQDSEFLVVADARTGRPYSFPARVVEADAAYRYLVGSSTGDVFLMGSSAASGNGAGNRGKGRAVGRVVRYDPRNPGEAGVPLDLPDDVTGRGRAVGGLLYCPTRKGLYVADFTRPRAPSLRDPLIAWEDAPGVAREALILESMVLIAANDGTIQAFPVKH